MVDFRYDNGWNLMDFIAPLMKKFVLVGGHFMYSISIDPKRNPKRSFPSQRDEHNELNYE